MNQNQEDILKIIENLNYECLLERNKHKKNDVKKLFFNSIKTFNFKYALKRLLNKKKNDQQLNVNQNLSLAQLKIHNNSSKKIAVYTCITGDYDNVFEPIAIEDNCDYFIFTDNLENKNTLTWKVRKIPNYILDLKNKVLINRYIKMHPYDLFKDEYDYSIYIDGNITSISNISLFCEKTSTKAGIALHKHYNKECIYDEMKTCEIVGKGNVSKIKLQEKQYRKEKFPEKFGLYECNVIVCDMKNTIGERIMNSWWEEFLRTESMRDQICLPYCLWKNGMEFQDIGIIGNNVFLNPKIRINKHV